MPYPKNKTEEYSSIGGINQKASLRRVIEEDHWAVVFWVGFFLHIEENYSLKAVKLQINLKKAILGSFSVQFTMCADRQKHAIITVDRVHESHVAADIYTVTSSEITL